ncbi:MAG: bifunctional homocysteine S-methyltransferase/methylenetetrahydrofolate reductase, partial [Deltaproteobacteria bacterium]|nr:bifunctional homocysteine S-methyltransferase/methylenetetrahydrofolate reductase [Deltaproteobacteria bacterium]
MKRDFLKTLTTQGILADGAMGTELYVKGVFINRCYDELCLSNPDLIRSIHKAYVAAGAELLETNTFTANRPALAAFGFEDKVTAINEAAAKLACEAIGEQGFVAGSVGPISWTKKDSKFFPEKEMAAIFAEQVAALDSGGVDVIILETFTRLEELGVAYRAARSATQLPIVCQVSLKYVGEGEFEGPQPEDVARTIDGWGADVIGVNCCDGPQGVFEAVKRMRPVTTRPLSAMPNAGLPQMVQGRLLYMATPEYFAEYARRYAQVGVSLIGGCCGTTPAHIREMKQFLKAVRPSFAQAAEDRPAEVHEQSTPPAGSKPVSPLHERSPFGKVLANRFGVSVEIDPPHGITPGTAIEGAKFLQGIGVDAINIADGPRAMARMSPMALGVMIEQAVGIETIIHYCCRDRNILGMQMDLIGSAALGLSNLMLITGDPPKMGNYPEATAVFDVDAIGLIRFAANLNCGIDFAGRPIKEATQFVIGCGCNPGAVDLDLEVERFRKKIDVGAEYVFSQPVYDPKLLEEFFRRTRDFPAIPFYVGILPLASIRNAEFLHNEVPGMQIPKPVMD